MKKHYLGGSMSHKSWKIRIEEMNNQENEKDESLSSKFIDFVVQFLVKNKNFIVCEVDENGKRLDREKYYCNYEQIIMGMMLDILANKEFSVFNFGNGKLVRLKWLQE